MLVMLPSIESTHKSTLHSTTNCKKYVYVITLFYEQSCVHIEKHVEKMKDKQWNTWTD